MQKCILFENIFDSKRLLDKFSLWIIDVASSHLISINSTELSTSEIYLNNGSVKSEKMGENVE